MADDGVFPGLPARAATRRTWRVKKVQPPAPATAPTHSPALRRFLYFTAAMTGAAIMIVEILGAKMLSPYLGTSHFVWTAQIAVTLVALACGYYAGGWWVDRSLELGRLYAAILAAGVYLAFTIAVIEPLAYACLKFQLALGSLLTSAVLYFLPLSLLAMVGPFLIRVLTDSVSGVGGNVGRLTAISTLGSFLGTVLIGYLLIPHLRNSVTMFLTAGVLMALGGGYFMVFRGKAAVTASVLVAVGLGVAAGGVGLRGERFRAGQFDELYHGNSNFGILQVLQRRDSPFRSYLNDYLTQNTYDTNEQKSLSMFTYMLHGLARAYTTNISDALCIGLGVGIVPMEFAHEGARVDVVEINPAVVPVARDFFNLQPERLNIFLEDGRCYLNRCATQYDAVVLDAFLGDSCPSHLMTRETFREVKRLLRPGGVIVINTFGSFQEGRDFFAASLAKTLASVFPSVRIHASESGNMLFVAAPRPDLAMVQPPDFSRVHPFCAANVREAFASLREPHPAHGLVLTDDFNPVEFHDAVNREFHRKTLALSMRDL
jgi:spermidine synthase